MLIIPNIQSILTGQIVNKSYGNWSMNIPVTVLAIGVVDDAADSRYCYKCD